MRRLNAKLLFLLLATGIVLGAALFLVHWLQTGRIAQIYLARADLAQEQGRADQAVRFLSRYLELVPDDIENRARLGDLLASDRIAVSPAALTRALFVLEQVLAKQPDRHDLRRRLVHVALDLERYDLAQEHLNYLKEAEQLDSDAAQLLARLLEAQNNWDEAAKWYRQAIAGAPGQIDSYVRLADLLRRRLAPDGDEAAQQADTVMQELIEKNKGSFEAYLAHWHYQKQWLDLTDADDLAQAEESVAQALRLAPERADVILAAAELAQRQGQKNKEAIEEARRHLQRGRQLFPSDLRMYRELALLELRQGQRPQAIALLREGIQALTGDARCDLLWTLGNVLLDGGEMDQAKDVIAQMAQAKSTPAWIDYMNARLAMRQGRWAEAAKVLERTRPSLITSPELTKQTDLFLGRCYEGMVEPGAQLAAFSRVVAGDPASVPARLGMAAALSALNRVDDALDQYRQVIKLPGAPESAWIELARLLAVRTMQHGPRDRKWQEFDAALEQAAQKNPNSLQVLWLRADVLVARNEFAQARTLLESAQKQQPKQVEVWAALSALALRQNQLDDAGRLLDEAEKETGDSAILRLARARFWAQKKGAEASAAIDKLAQEMDRLSPEDQARLLPGLADAQFSVGNITRTYELWSSLARLPQYQKDLRLRLLLFDIAVRAADETAMTRVIGELQELEGAQGSFCRYTQAVRLIWQGRRGKKAGLDEARVLLDAVAARKPTWPAGYLARADLETQLGNVDQAIANYRRVIELGESSPHVVYQLCELLNKQQRAGEAAQEMQKLQKRGPLTPDLQRLAVDIALRNPDATQAVKLALDAVSTDSDDYRVHLWHGQLLAARGQQAQQAEQELRIAVQRGPQAPETWLAFVQFLGAAKRTQDAEAAIAQAQAQLPPDQVPLILAQCHELLGQSDKALEQYRAALAKKPDDVSLLRNLAYLYLRTGKLQLAEPELRKLIDGKIKASAGDAAWARRSLALALAGSNDYRRYAEALALVGLRFDDGGKIVEDASPASDDLAADQIARARVLASQPRREPRLRAIALLEEVSRRQSLAGNEQFLLAQLYQAEGQWAKSRDLFRMVTADNRSPLQLAYYVRSLIRQGELDEAKRCLDRLEQLEKARQAEPGALGSIELRALALEARGQGGKAIALLQEDADRPDAKPEKALLLIVTLARQQRFAEAFERCRRSREKCPPELVGGATVALLRAAQAKEDQCAEAERWLKAEIEKNPKSTVLLLHLAALCDFQGRYADTEASYRKLLELDPHNFVALNNLACLLALRSSNVNEALPMINHAIEVAGPRPELLDTLAMVHLALRQQDRALALLERANADAPGGPRYFHLALAHQLANNASASSEALRKAQSLGLKPEQLHPLERVTYLKMVKELEQR